MWDLIILVPDHFGPLMGSRIYDEFCIETAKTLDAPNVWKWLVFGVFILSLSFFAETCDYCTQTAID